MARSADGELTTAIVLESSKKCCDESGDGLGMEELHHTGKDRGCISRCLSASNAVLLIAQLAWAILPDFQKHFKFLGEMIGYG